MSDQPPLSRLDLNLLVSLDALLTERSVTRAAERLHLSQPALSASLARLRTHFNDPILARRGNSYDLTPLAIRLTTDTSTALEAARRVFESHAAWNAELSTREFSIYGSDYSFVSIGRQVSRLARQQAPGVRFRFMLHSPAVVEDVATRLRTADAMLIPRGFLSDLQCADLWQDHWVGITDANDTTIGDRATMTDLSERPWVFTYQSREAFTSASRQIQQLGVEPKIEAVVEGFLALAYFIEGTDRLGLVQASVAPALERAAGVRAFALPFEATPVLNALWWHPVHDRDPEHQWMRGLFAQAAAELRDAP